jgi:hypothetical protein
MWMMKLNVFSANLRQRAAQIAAGWLEQDDTEQQLDQQSMQLGFFSVFTSSQGLTKTIKRHIQRHNRQLRCNSTGASPFNSGTSNQIKPCFCWCSLANLGTAEFMHRVPHQSQQDAWMTMVHGLRSTTGATIMVAMVGLAMSMMAAGLATMSMVAASEVGLATTIMMGGLATTLIGV